MVNRGLHLGLQGKSAVAFSMYSGSSGMSASIAMLPSSRAGQPAEPAGCRSYVQLGAEGGYASKTVVETIARSLGRWDGAELHMSIKSKPRSLQCGTQVPSRICSHDLCLVPEFT